MLNNHGHLLSCEKKLMTSSTTLCPQTHQEMLIFNNKLTEQYNYIYAGSVYVCAHTYTHTIYIYIYIYIYYGVSMQGN